MHFYKHLFNIYELIFLVVLISLFYGCNGNLRTHYAEELCGKGSIARINLRFQKSITFASFPIEPMNCEMIIEPERGFSIVVAFFQYNLDHGDRMTFKDRNAFELSVTGSGYFLDERKSLIFDGPFTFKYITNNTYQSDRLKFQMVITQVHDSPCSTSEYQCHNNKCIPNTLACDQHNHCGDIRDVQNCSPTDKFTHTKTVSSKTSVWIIAIIVSSVVLGIVIIMFIVIIVRGCVLRKKTTVPHHLPTVASSQDTQQAAPPTVFGRIRQSFRNIRQPTAPPLPNESSEPTPENYQVPSMYPQLPTTNDKEGVDNPQFKPDE